MLCHESVESYYSANFSALFYGTSAKKVNITNRFTLDDFENMLPYEREIYMSMMQNKMADIQEKTKNT